MGRTRNTFIMSLLRQSFVTQYSANNWVIFCLTEERNMKYASNIGKKAVAGLIEFFFKIYIP